MTTNMCLIPVLFAFAFSAIFLEVSSTPVNYLSISDHNEYYHIKNHSLNHHYDHHEKANKKVYRAQDLVGHKNRVQIHGHYDLPGKTPKAETTEQDTHQEFPGEDNLWDVDNFLDVLRNATANNSNTNSSPHDKINKVMVIVKTYKDPKIKSEDTTIPIITEVHDPKVVEIHDNGLTLNDILEANARSEYVEASESANSNGMINKLSETTTRGYEVWEFDM